MEKEAIVPGLVGFLSCSCECEIPELGDGLSTSCFEVPIMEEVHEEVEVVKAGGRIGVTLHVVAGPEGDQVVVVDAVGPVLSTVEVASEFLHNR